MKLDPTSDAVVRTRIFNLVTELLEVIDRFSETEGITVAEGIGCLECAKTEFLRKALIQ
jgi:ubiquitin C-terminal hydrolase